METVEEREGGLSKRFDFLQGLLVSGPIPVLHQVRLMKGRPFYHKTESSRGKSSREKRKTLDIDQAHLIPVIGMEMRRVVVVPEHLDGNPKESGNLRHGSVRVSNSEKCPQDSFQ